MVLKVIYALILELLGFLVLEMTDALGLELLVLEVLGFLKASPRSLVSFASTLFNRGLGGKICLRIFCDFSLSSTLCTHVQ